MSKTLQKFLKYFTFFLTNSADFQLLKNLFEPSFVRTEDIPSPFELYEFFNQTDAHGLVCVQFLAAFNSYLGSEKNISKNVMSEFFPNLSLQALNELDKTNSRKFDAINELNKSINNLLMDEANKSINQKNRRLSLNSVNDFKSENKKIEEDIVSNILNDFTVEHPHESDHLFYPNTAYKINKHSQEQEDKKKKLGIVLNERPHQIKKGMIFDAKKNLLKTLAGIDGRYF